jgi:hypothetical protein
MFRIFLAIVAALTATAQTHVDLRTQAKNIDFTSATSTKPVKAGTALPNTCGVGELFFKTDAPAGSNVYACTALNQWTAASGASTPLQVESHSTPVGARGTANFTTGPGLFSVISDDGSRITIEWAVDTAVVQTHAVEQAGAALLCASTNHLPGSYQCEMSPALTVYTTGMVLHWMPDVNGSGVPVTLNVDNLGARAVKAADGIADPAAGDIIAGQLSSIWYDGAVFRLSAGAAASGATTGLADPGTNGILYRNGLRSTAAATANELSGPLSCVAAGANNAYACSLVPPISAYVAGSTYWFRANAANTGAATIAFNSLPPKTIKKSADQDVSANDIKAGQWVMLTYDGTTMQMQSQTGTTPVTAGVGTGLLRAGSPLTGTELSGDATTTGSNVVTFASVNSSPGSTGSESVIPAVTVNAKGLATAVTGVTTLATCVVTLLSTPVFALANCSASTLILGASAVTSSTMTGAVTGKRYTINIVQDATGNRSFAAPINWLGSCTIDARASIATTMVGVFDGSNLVIDTCTTNVTPTEIDGPEKADPGQPASNGRFWFDSTAHRFLYRNASNSNLYGPMLMDDVSTPKWGTVAFTSLGSPGNGTQKYCSDCAVTSAVDSTCAASGSGAMAFRIGGAWKCLQ